MEAWIDIAAIYVLAACALLRLLRDVEMRDVAFCVLNILASYLCFFHGGLGIPGLCLYILFVLAHYLLLNQQADKPDNTDWAMFAMAAPLLALMFAKSMHIGGLLGFSYLSFRMTYTAYEIYIRRATLPPIWRYTGFALFPLTFLIGPINPYSNHSQSLLTQQGQPAAAYSRCLGRILVGILKCYILGSLFKTLTFANYWETAYQHNFSDFTISCISTALYIYFNFSGATDIMIGAAGLMGIRVAENFNNPFLSRNLAEFWTRNHITLANVARDMVYTPLTLWLMRLLKGNCALAVSTLATVATFFLIGIWHGNEEGFALFGLMHGVGVAAVNLYAAMARRFPPALKTAAESLPARLFCTALTFMYVSYSTVFFGTSWQQLETIWAQLY